MYADFVCVNWLFMDDIPVYMCDYDDLGNDNSINETKAKPPQIWMRMILSWQ